MRVVKNTRYKESQEVGAKAESLFAEIYKSRGKELRKANTKQDKFEHIDFFFANGESVDVKARKKINRKNKAAQDDLIFVEIKNVSGKNGWLHGKADWIAFERENDFVIVSRKELVKLVDFLVDKEKWVDKTENALYKVYRRWNRPNEMVTLLKMKDILKLRHCIVFK